MNSMYPKMNMTQGATEKKPDAGRVRRTQVRRSGVHGKGMYAVAPLASGEVVIEYTGERIACDPLEGHEKNTLFATELECFANIRVLNGRRHGCLVDEHADVFLVCGVFLADQF